MTNWAFETWPRIILGGLTLAIGFALLHVLAGVVTGHPAVVDGATAALFSMMLVGYLAIGGYIRRNSESERE